MLLSEAIDKFLNAITGEVAPRTLAWYRTMLRPLREHLGHGDLVAITIDDLRAWRSTLIARSERYTDHPTHPPRTGKLSAYTIHGHIQATRRLFLWLVAEGHLATSPATRLKFNPLPDEPPKDVSDATLEKLLDAARDNARDYALLLFLADTACRVGGAAGLRVADLNLRSGQAIVREKGRGGAGRSRTVYISQPTIDALDAWARERPVSEWVFCNRQGLPLSAHGIYQVLKRLARAAGVTERWNPHGLRHGWAHGALQRGADLSIVSKMMGHRSIAVTASFYARWSDSELKERHATLSRVGSPTDRNEKKSPGD